MEAALKIATSNSIKIDKGVPFATKQNSKYPWHEMDIGDSFLFPAHIKNGSESARTASQRYAPKKFVARKIDGRTRCWRVA